METDITLIFDKLKARPDARYSTMDITATYAMVSAGLGISVNNAINHQDGYPGVVERPMNPHQMMEIGLACGENLAPAAQAFLDFVKERLPEYIPAIPIAESNPPIVVGMRQTNKDRKEAMVMTVPV